MAWSEERLAAILRSKATMTAEDVLNESDDAAVLLRKPATVGLEQARAAVAEKLGEKKPS